MNKISYLKSCIRDKTIPNGKADKNTKAELADTAKGSDL